jgi:hypothetical protein
MGHGELNSLWPIRRRSLQKTRGNSSQIANGVTDLCLGNSGDQLGARRW